MKNTVAAAMFVGVTSTSPLYANDLVAIFDPCAHDLSETKSDKRSGVQSLQTLVENPDLAIAEYTSIIKDVWDHENRETLKNQNFTDAQVDLIWKRDFEQFVSSVGGHEQFKNLTSERARVELEQMRKDYDEVLTRKADNCDTDLLPSAGRVANNAVKLPLTIAGSLFGEEGAKAGENLGKYITMEKNPLKAVERNLITRPAKEVKRFFKKIF